MRAELTVLTSQFRALQNNIASIQAELETSRHIPSDFIESYDGYEFMSYSTCHALDFIHPEYAKFCKLLKRPQRFHRKDWEWVFIAYTLEKEGVLKPGAHGIGFGVGTEPLTAFFASQSAKIVATDAPPDLDASAKWSPAGQHSSSIDGLRHDEIIGFDELKEKVTHEYCDMNNIGRGFSDFDFNWSSCCFEHLGDIDAGVEFLVESTERTLRPGGIGVHTTELNLSSNTDTIEQGETVLYRKCDIERMARRLQERGHTVRPIRIAPSRHPLDFHVDVPPYTHNLHLRLKLMGYTATSIGLVIIRGHN